MRSVRLMVTWFTLAAISTIGHAENAKNTVGNAASKANVDPLTMANSKNTKQLPNNKNQILNTGAANNNPPKKSTSSSSASASSAPSAPSGSAPPSMKTFQIFYKRTALITAAFTSKPNFTFTCSESPGSHSKENGADWWVERCATQIRAGTTFKISGVYHVATGGAGSYNVPIDGKCGAGPGGECTYTINETMTATLPQFSK